MRNLVSETFPDHIDIIPAVSRRNEIEAGTAWVRRKDPVMRKLVRNCPPFTGLRLQRNRFGMLVHSILSQQISIHAARAIRSRLVDLAGPAGLTPERLKGLGIEELRSIGISRSKARSIQDLADKAAREEIALARAGRMSDSAVIEDLVQVRGIGVWTAQMFLIFSLGRLDVFPEADYGVRSAIRNLYGMEELPNRSASEPIAERWAPYRTIGTWYLWRSHERESIRGKRASGGV
jgi:DNA-3-methyladenine glycosylase II